MSKTKKSKKKKWYETGEFADGYQLWDFYKTFKNKKNNEKKDAKKKSVSQDIKESKNKKAQNTTTYLPRVENGKVSFDPVVQFYGFKNEEERQNYIKENPDLYVANGGFKYEPSVLQKNYASISDKEKKNAVEAAKGVVEKTNDKSPMTRGDAVVAGDHYDNDKWFKKGAYEDGYQKWDFLKTAGSTIGDVAVGAATGMANMVEGIVDLAAYDAWMQYNIKTGQFLDKAIDDVLPLFGDKITEEQKKAMEKSTLPAKALGKMLLPWTTVGMSDPARILSIAEDIRNIVKVAGEKDTDEDKTVAEYLKEFAQFEVANHILGPADEWVSKNSVLGSKADAISEGLGQIAAIVGTAGAAGAAGLGGAATTAITTGLSGFSSMGSGISEAYNDGASDIEAWGYGTIKGAIDAGTELIFGGLSKWVNATGLSKGIGGLDDMFAKKASSKLAGWIKNPAVRTWIGNSIESTIKAGGEGFEEVLAGIGTAFAKKLTYLSDEDLGELIANENLLEQFIVGFFVGEIAQSLDFAKQDTDMDTGRTADEELDVDKKSDDENRQGHHNNINVKEFIEGLWEGSRKSKSDENAKNVEKSQLETIDNVSENGIIKNNNFDINSLPEQMHHFATNKNKKYTPKFNEVASRYGLQLDASWNKEVIKHRGKHPYIYHMYVLNEMKRCDRIANGDVEIFINEFESVKKKILDNPFMLRKDFWKDKDYEILFNDL